MDNDNLRAWRRIEEEEADLASVAFILAHPPCGGVGGDPARAVVFGVLV